MSSLISAMIGQASLVLLDRAREGDAGGLPEELRPRNLPQAYGIQHAVSRRSGAIGGWQICPAPPEVGLASAPLPLGSLRPDLARIAITESRPTVLRPALAFRVGQSLPEYAAPFAEKEVEAAIESTHPALLIADCGLHESAGNDALTAIAQSCATVGLVYGSPTRGLPQEAMAELALVRWFGAKRKRILGNVAIGDFLEPLTWLANFGAVWAGGLMVGQMVAMALTTEAIRLEASTRLKLIVGDFGKVEIRAKRTAS